VVTRGFSIAEDGADLIQASRMWWPRRWNVVARGDGGLGRDEGKDTRRSEALHRQQTRAVVESWPVILEV